jgi:O-antigen/teichoic acid export membrane protein
MSSSIKEQTLSGVKWNALGQFSAYAIQFVLGIVIARLLDPADYGVIGMLAIFMAIAQSFVNSGFGNALIRKSDRTEVDCSTAFYFNVAVAVLLYGVLFLSAPAIADFYNTPLLTDVLRVYSLTLIIGSLGIVPRALRSVAVDFKTQAYASVISVIVSGLVGLYLAFSGYGVWALVWQAIISSCVSVVVIWVLARWRPLWAYSWESFRSMFSYGSRLLASGLLHTVYTHASSILIGKFYTPAELGNYDRGNSIASLPSLRLSSVFNSVSFPILSKVQNDDERLKNVYHKYVAMTSLVIFFIMTLLAVVARPLVLLLLTEKWLGAVPFLQVFCFAYMFDSICRLNNNMMYVKGWSGLFLKLEIIKKAVVTPFFLLAIPYGPLVICYGAVLHTVVDITCSTYCLKRFLGIELRQYARVAKYFFLSLLACVPAAVVCALVASPWVSLPVGAVSAGLLYWALLHKDENMKECLSTLAGFVRAR